MTTFKNNPKYAELVLTYLELAQRGDTPLTCRDVLKVFAWRFKGGSLREASEATRLKPETSEDAYPDGLSWELSSVWPRSEDCVRLSRIVGKRLEAGRMRNRAVLGRLGTYLLLTSSHGKVGKVERVYSGMKSVYHIFGLVWDWARSVQPGEDFHALSEYTMEMVVATGACSKVHIPTAGENTEAYLQLLATSRAPGLMIACEQMREVLKSSRSRQVMLFARLAGISSKEGWELEMYSGKSSEELLGELGDEARCLWLQLGPLSLSVHQGCCMLGLGEHRYAMGNSDMERLHQMLMSSTSALVGVAAQAAVGTEKQKLKARLGLEVADANLCRIVRSSRLVPMGDEVLVCKGYRRAYTAHLGWMAGKLCTEEAQALVAEAESTAERGVIDVDGMLYDARMLDAATSLNATKMFKVCPAPDVSPGQAMMDRITQIGDGNVVDPEIMPDFERELRTQILRAYIRYHPKKLSLRDPTKMPTWWRHYLKGEMGLVPSAELDEYLAWEGTAKMPDISKYDPKHWKDSGLGPDTIRQSVRDTRPRYCNNMMTRLLYDEECPMPGRELLNEDHVIKFFVKAEGHKEPARGIFSANLTDRQAQSWMERGVEQVATKHPSFMIGTEADERANRIARLTSLPDMHNYLPLYYSFDISGWSAKMPAEPQHISHSIWEKLYGGHLYRRAREINEGAHVFMSLDGYEGWFKNTHANLEGYNAKEMTMVLIALLSLSVSRWRKIVVDKGLLYDREAKGITALLFAYIDDGLSRIDLPRRMALEGFRIYKEVVIDTFSRCGFSVEVSKCFPSHRFAIFLNEVYLAGRHVVHGVRAAMSIGAEPTERHTSLVERVSSVSTGCRGAVMAGLNPQSAVFLMAYHVRMHLREWVNERDPVVLATWSMCPRTWGGLGLPNTLQLFVSGSGSAFEEGVATLQSYAKHNDFAKAVFMALCNTELTERTATGVLTAPLSARIDGGYMVDSRVAGEVRRALQEGAEEGRISSYAGRLLKYANTSGFKEFAESVVALDSTEVVQEQMLDNVSDSHPHTIFSGFAKRVERSSTVSNVVGFERFRTILNTNLLEARESVAAIRRRGAKH